MPVDAEPRVEVEAHRRPPPVRGPERLRANPAQHLESLERTLHDPGLRHALRQQAWVVDCKPPFAGPEHVLAYLGRYTHRVAFSNDRLLAVADGRVRFRWRDYADGDRVKVMDLEVEEFLVGGRP